MSEALDLDAIEKLADAATPGPWFSDAPFQGKHDGVSFSENAGALLLVDDVTNAVADAAFIAWCREGVPALIQRVREAEASFDTMAERCVVAMNARAAAEARVAALSDALCDLCDAVDGVDEGLRVELGLRKPSRAARALLQEVPK